MDVFPSHYSTKYEKLEVPDKLKVPDFWSQDFEHIICSLNKDRVIFERFSQIDVIKSSEHFDYVLRGVCSMSAENISWKKVYTHLNHPAQSGSYENRNTDQKLAYRCRNVFLTKKLFTFGLLKTGADECHVYQTSKCPLMCYYLKPAFTDPEPALGTFPWLERRKYDIFTMEPSSTYCVPENTLYLIISLHKTLFRVDKFLAPVFDTLWKGLNEPAILKTPNDTPFLESSTDTPYLGSLIETPIKKRKDKGEDEAFPSKAQKCIDFQTAGTPPRMIPIGYPSSSHDGNSFRDQTLHITTMTSTENFCGTPERQPSSNTEDLDQLGRDTQHVNQLEPTPNKVSMSQIINNGHHTDESVSKSDSLHKPETSLTEYGNQPVKCEPPDQPLVNRDTFDLPSNTIAEGDRASLRDTAEPPTTLPPLSANTPLLQTSHHVLLQGIPQCVNIPSGDKPAMYETKDNFGNTYLFKPVDMNWAENDRRPLEAMPYITNFKGRYFIYVPVKQ